MCTEVERKKRLENFEYLMKIMDAAEGERNTEEGAFSFLWENSYVREVVVTPGMKTGIAGLKTFLATEVLEIYGANNKSKVSYKNIHAQLSGDLSKKYSFSFVGLDEVFDLEKNKEAFFEHCWLSQEDNSIREQINNVDIWLPYLLMEKLRKVVWKKLRAFFQLCEQESCSECNKKSEVYFQFIQAVVLYEIFLQECIQEQGSAFAEESMALMKGIEAEMEVVKNKGISLAGYTGGQGEELVSVMQDILSNMNIIKDIQIEKLSWLVAYVGIFQLMTAEFGISYHAMCYLLMVFEAMNVCGVNMRGIKKISLKIMDELSEVYGKNLEILQNYNRKRAKRYKKVNEKLEELLEKYGDEDFDEAVVIVTFMEELCKSPQTRNMNVFRGLECMLGQRVYRDFGGSSMPETMLSNNSS